MASDQVDTGDDRGTAALQAVDKVLEDQPDKVGHDFSAATRAVVQYRNALAATWRQSQDESDRQRLAQVNAVLSVVVGGHFPLGGVPWPHLHKAREQLSALVEASRLPRRGQNRKAASRNGSGSNGRKGSAMKQPHTEQAVRHTDDEQNTGNHKKPGTQEAHGADRVGGTRAGKENVEPAAERKSNPPR